MKIKICIWLQGLSGSGKTTLATNLKKKFEEKNLKCILLDGDTLRLGLNSNLGFSDKDRAENIRRTAELAKLFLSEDYVVIVSAITPLEVFRDSCRNILGKQYIEVFVDTPLSVCKSRDPKGLYKLVEEGKIVNFTGISSTFEIPEKPDIIIKTSTSSVEESSTELNQKIFENALLRL